MTKEQLRISDEMLRETNLSSSEERERRRTHYRSAIRALETLLGEWEA